MKINYLNFFVGALLIANSAFSQVGINTNDPKAQLDVEAADAVSPQPSDGLLVPRVQTLPAAGADQHSMIIYLTNTIGTFTPGFYYWDENVSSWTSFGGGGTAPTGDYWSLEGNTGTNSATDFIGTTDNEDFVIRTNNNPTLSITTSGQLITDNDLDIVALGWNAGNGNSGTRNIHIGRRAGINNSGNNNVFVGRNAGLDISGSDNIIMGRNAGNGRNGSNNILLGRDVGNNFGPNSGSNNMVFGNYEGRNNFPFAQMLYIENGTDANDNTFTTPLISGSFSSNRVGINLNLTPNGSRNGPLTHTLTVGGDVYASGDFITPTNTYPDYVFQKYFEGESSILPEYEFKSLEEVEQFIKNHGHLPGVKSYKEVEENNFNIELSATSIKNLEKIEELFLYSIELNSKVKSQTKELQEKDSQIDDLEQRIERLEKLILEKNK